MSVTLTLHKWLGIPAGLIISAICFTGAILALQDEVIGLANRDVARVSAVGDAVVSIDELASKINASAPDGTSVVSLNISQDEHEAYRFRLNDEDGSLVYANQYTGEISEPRHQMHFFNIVRRLHRFLLDSRPAEGGFYWGKNIVGACTLLLAIILVTGIIIWWPKHRAHLSHHFRVRFGRGLSKLNFDLHCNASIYVSLIVLVMALTGLTWSFTWYRDAVFALLGTEAPKTEGVHHAQREAPEATDYAQLYRTWESARAELATSDERRPMTFSDSKVEVQLSKYGNMRAKDTYILTPADDPKQSVIKTVKRYQDSTRATKIKGWIATLHRGAFGALPIKILWSLSALLATLMPITGYIIWLRKPHRHH